MSPFNKFRIWPVPIPTGAYHGTWHQTCNWFQWNRLRIRNRLRFVWIQNRNRLRSTIFPLESESDSTPLVLEQNRSRMKKSEMAWSRLRIRNQTFEASLESESDSTPLGTWLSGIGVGINYCWVEVESESTPADRNQLQVCVARAGERVSSTPSPSVTPQRLARLRSNLVCD